MRHVHKEMVLVGGDCGTAEGPVVCFDSYIAKLNPQGAGVFDLPRRQR